MTRIIPFRAVRPSSDKANLVVSRSYEDYGKEELHSVLAYNPFSFLHIINPGFKFHHEISGTKRFSLVKNRYLEFKEEGIFIQDEKPGIYIYYMKTRNNEFCGFFCGSSVEDYEMEVIRKHESTIASREILFKEYLKTVGFNAEPVLLTYPDHPEITAILKKAQNETPEYQFSTTDRTLHKLWKLDDVQAIAQIQGIFENISPVYIADGHHRSASSHLLYKEMLQQPKPEAQNDAYRYFMSYMIPESALRIYEYNRLIRDLNGYTKEAFLMKLDEVFRIENRGVHLYRPSKKHHFGMYLDGAFYSLYLRKSYPVTDALSDLDTEILYRLVLKPTLGIKDLRNDERIAYSYGKHSMIKIKDEIDGGNFAVGFYLYPIDVQQLKAIADAGQVMPPKSTYIQPKLRSGLTIYEF